MRRGPGAWRGGLGDRRQGEVEKLRRPELEVAAARATHAGAEHPKGAAVAVVGADILEPAAIEAEEVAKPAFSPVECEVQECRVGRRQAVQLGRALAELLELDGQEQSPGVVVGAIAFGEVRDRGVGVLEHSGRVGHSNQVIEPPARQIHGLFGQGSNRQRFVRRVEPAAPARWNDSM